MHSGESEAATLTHVPALLRCADQPDAAPGEKVQCPGCRDLHSIAIWVKEHEGASTHSGELGTTSTTHSGGSPEFTGGMPLTCCLQP